MNYITSFLRSHFVKAKSTTAAPKRNSPSPASAPHLDDAANVTLNPQVEAVPVSKEEALTPKGGLFENDVSLLLASFISDKRSQLRDVISLITAIRDVDKDGHLANVFETCARFALLLLRLIERRQHRQWRNSKGKADIVLYPSLVRLMLRCYRRTMEKLKAQIVEDPTFSDKLNTRVNDEIERIKPSFLRNAEAMPLEDFSLFLDAALGRGITVLSILESASLFIPVPFVYPTISQVLYMMKAAEQTRANLNEMKAIAARAEEFAVLTASAVVLPGKTSDLSEGGGLGDFARELEAIALECNRLRQQPRLVRYVLHQSHARELQALNNRLVDTARRLQDLAWDEGILLRKARREAKL